MRCLILATVLCSFCGSMLAQTATPSDEALLRKTRALYDAPFERNLVSFDCAVQFDWTKHLVDFLGVVPPALKPTVERLQTIPHRVFVDHSGAVVSAQPKEPDLTGVKGGTELENALKGIIPAGISAWLPASMNEILPMGPTKYTFQKVDPGYKLVMNGPGVAATLLLADDLRMTSIVSQLPQAMRAITEYMPGPDGLLLSSVKTAPTIDSTTASEADFAFTYQPVQGLQLPSLVTVTSAVGETWRFTLTDCKVMTGIRIKVGLPKE